MFTTPPELYADYKAKYEEPANHIEALLRASIVTLDLLPRLLYPLGDNGIKTVGDLLEQYRRGLKNVPQIGVSAALEIERVLTLNGLISLTSPAKDFAR